MLHATAGTEQMNRTKQIFGTLCGAGVIGLWIFWGISSDYTWAESVAAERFREGWSVAACSNNVVEITSPWTFFKPPVSTIWFIRVSDIRTRGSLKIVNVLVLQRNPTGRRREETFVEVHDCRADRYAFLETENGSEGADFRNVKWYPVEKGTPGAALHRFVCRWKYEALIPHPAKQIEMALDGWPSL